MARFAPGDRVRVDIPDEADPDHAAYHGATGAVAAVSEDDLGGLTGDPRDSVHYTVELDDGRSMSFRWRDLRPAG